MKDKLTEIFNKHGVSMVSMDSREYSFRDFKEAVEEYASQPTEQLHYRSEVIKLLDNFVDFLMGSGYLDSDVRTEEPYAIDSFMAIWDEHNPQPTEALDEGEIDEIKVQIFRQQPRDFADGYSESAVDKMLGRAIKSALSQSRKVPTEGEIKAIFKKEAGKVHSDLAGATYYLIPSLRVDFIIDEIHNLITGKA